MGHSKFQIFTKQNRSLFFSQTLERKIERMDRLLRRQPIAILRFFSSMAPNDTLRRRIARAGDPSASVIPLLDEWLDRGNQLRPSDLQSMVKMLRRFKRFSHALQILEWISEQRIYNLSAGDIAIQLDLIAKVRGLEESEKFFETTPVDVRDYHVYGALLNCYASMNSVHKAEATFQKMREFGFIKGPLTYNVMLNLYTRLGNHVMIEKLLHEMEENNVKPDRFTVNTQLHAYAVVSNIGGMEKFLMKCETDPGFTLDWHAYVTVANAYLKARSTEKAVAMLRRSEQLVNPKSRKLACEVLMTIYGAAGRREDVYRLWDFYKSTGQFYNTGYICVISALLKVEDIEGAENVYTGWEIGLLLFDMRIPHVLISGYCKKGMMEKAEDVVSRLLRKGRRADASTWERLALGYKTVGQMDKAVERWKRAIKASQSGWRPNRLVLGACVEYLEGRGDMEGLREVLRLLSEGGHVSYDKLVNDVDGGGLSWKIINVMGGNRYADAFEEEGEGKFSREKQETNGLL
ncbi:PREDICTED: pentatricopeptide repeat-containing protein At2g20710, mitochondrial [Tarenaya hassleriana]|uniref:pentatricopeptide repeat-containing protein At2g20710, mitochondrial n=1 Tax=Tarenaya hassleriana TaxID=28532 RepID=UPI00053C1D26|nr:PREDICTED: pentatricopeptide repeat-containing protein At2g20710, mitochondrial [Tarenaya hassleriana]